MAAIAIANRKMAVPALNAEQDLRKDGQVAIFVKILHDDDGAAPVFDEKYDQLCLKNKAGRERYFRTY